MKTNEKRRQETAARALGAAHHGRGFTRAVQGDWPPWKVAAYMEGYGAAEREGRPKVGVAPRKKSLKLARAGRLR